MIKKIIFSALCFTCAASPIALEAMTLQRSPTKILTQKNWSAFIKSSAARPFISLKQLCSKQPLLTTTCVTAAVGISALCLYLSRNFIFTHLAEHTQTQGFAKKLHDWKIINTSTTDYFSVMPMTYATKNKMSNAIVYLAKDLKVDITQCDNNKNPFYYALENDDLDSIKLFVGINKKSVNTHCGWFDTPFTLALKKGNPKIIKYLIEEGDADLNLKSTESQYNLPPFIKLFQMYLSTPNDQSRNTFFEIMEHCVKTEKDYLYTLYSSTQYNDGYITYFLDCRKGENPHLTFDVIFDTYFDAKDQKQREYSFKIIRCCIEQCPNKEEQIDRLYAALYKSIHKGSKEAVSQLIDIAKKYTIPLGKIREIPLLFDMKCKKHSVSLLEKAFENYSLNSNAFDIIKLLFEITRTEVCTKTVLDGALYTAIRRHGCENCCDDDYPQNNHLALFNIIKQYLETNLFDDSLLYLLEHAIGQGAPEVVKLLVETNKIDLKTKGPRLLCQTIKKSNLEAVRILVESKQFDINQKSNDTIHGVTPLHQALKSYLSVVKKHPYWSNEFKHYQHKHFFKIIDYLINTAKVDLTGDLNSCALCKSGSHSLLHDALSLYNSEEGSESVDRPKLIEIIKYLLKMNLSSSSFTHNFDKFLGLTIAPYASGTDQKNRLDIIKYVVEHGGIRNGIIPQNTSQEIKNYLALAEACHKLETNPETFENFTVNYLGNDVYREDALRILFTSGSKKTITKIYQFFETFMSTLTKQKCLEVKKVITDIINDVASPHRLFWNIELPVRLPAQEQFAQKLHQIKKNENPGAAPLAKKLNDISFHFKSELDPWT
ncbi:MAG: hypothetical protein UV38_C0001G0319 [candidate division TM6 bacterium GW2011_GWE2_42_60]|nr:MAG: hypothetical protein UV38_C0001G0319 [candidate division TM6 bacterium GW2011_GWE2_42_60]HBY05491.1 hypothetical protein [Candidatus Dependentiae bacterium]